MLEARSNPIPPGAMRLIERYWQTIASLAMLLMAIGIARGKYSAMETRVEAIEQTHPDATAMLATHNDTETAAMRLQLDRIADGVADVRVDVARLCTAFGLRAITGLDHEDGSKFIPTNKNAPASP